MPSFNEIHGVIVKKMVENCNLAEKHTVILLVNKLMRASGNALATN